MIQYKMCTTLKYNPISLYSVEASSHFQALLGYSIVAAILLGASSNKILMLYYMFTMCRSIWIKLLAWQHIVHKSSNSPLLLKICTHSHATIRTFSSSMLATISFPPQTSYMLHHQKPILNRTPSLPWNTPSIMIQ